MQSQVRRILGSLPVFLAGAAAGATLLWLVSRRAEQASPGAQRPLDISGLETSVRELTGGERVSLRHLGGGIVEAFGDARDADVVERVLAFLRGRPGVSVVVNRIWTAGGPSPAVAASQESSQAS